MKILILYFSGTGNTAYVAQYIKENLTSEGHELTVSPLEMFKKENIVQYDMLVFGFPVYACDVPIFIQKYLEDIPVTTAKAVSIFCTKAFFTGDALRHGLQIFESRGYIPIAYADISMPGSDGLAFMEKNSSSAQKAINRDFSKLIEVDAMIEQMKEAAKVLEEHGVKEYGVGLSTNPFISLFGGLLNRIYPVFEEKLKRKFWADENCIKCGKCEKICPANNIQVKEEVCFGSNCYLCMRCIHQCPKEAIQIGKRTIGKFRWKGPLGNYDPLKLIT
ncbi:MAG: EFR1 family ferrodoxin [Bacillota bacterium]